MVDFSPHLVNIRCAVSLEFGHEDTDNVDQEKEINLKMILFLICDHGNKKQAQDGAELCQAQTTGQWVVWGG